MWALGVTVWQMLTGALLDDLQNLTNVVAVIFRVGNITETPQMPHDFSGKARITPSGPLCVRSCVLACACACMCAP